MVGAALLAPLLLAAVFLLLKLETISDLVEHARPGDQLAWDHFIIISTDPKRFAGFLGRQTMNLWHWEASPPPRKAFLRLLF